MSVYTGSTLIEAPLELVFEYVSVPENQPEWAVNFVRATRPLGDGRHVMQTPVGEMTYRVEADASRRTIDFVFETAQGESVLPTRVVRHPAGSIFTFTIVRQPGMPDEAWEDGKRGLDEELAVLKRRLESSLPIPSPMHPRPERLRGPKRHREEPGIEPFGAVRLPETNLTIRRYLPILGLCLDASREPYCLSRMRSSTSRCRCSVLDTPRSTDSVSPRPCGNGAGHAP
jgi:hypothetical protein